jgi:signal transduction histidine kinase/ActR/RegA family two-component response regulator
MIANIGVRARVMLVAVVPLLVLAGVLTALYTSLRLGDQVQALHDRGRAFSRQLAAASEYAVFSGNHEALQQLANSVLNEADVVGVSIVSRSGATLAHSGRLTAPPPDTRAGFGALQLGSVLRILEPVRAQAVTLDDMTPSPQQSLNATLGIVVVELSTERLEAGRREVLHTGLSSTLWVLLGSLLLAAYMGHGVSAPIRRVARTALQLGQGHLHERVPLSGGGSLRKLAAGVNEMAERLADAHALMTRRIEEATAELRQRKEDAERSSLAKSRFLAAASHDLRQPMHALALFSSELGLHALNPDAKRLARKIESSVEAMAELLDSLLDISRLDAGVLKPALCDFALQPVLTRIVEGQRAHAEARKLRLKLSPTCHWVLSDPVLLERILSNLVVNALRYTPAGSVLIVCRRRGERLRIEVRDSGIGIAADAHELIFQEFIQLDNAERSRDKGMGLGLPIVRRLAALLDHGVELISAPGRGSVFAITLPRASVVTDPPPEQEARAPGDLHGTRIALIDDDEPARSGLESLLQAWGCDIRAAENQDELLQQLTRDDWRPDLLISDFRLRGPMNGVELVELLRGPGYRPGLPMILISGDTGAETLTLARNAGIHMLHKPVRPARLRALMNRMLQPTAAGTDS